MAHPQGILQPLFNNNFGVYFYKNERDFKKITIMVIDAHTDINDKKIDRIVLDAAPDTLKELNTLYHNPPFNMEIELFSHAAGAANAVEKFLDCKITNITNHKKYCVHNETLKFEVTIEAEHYYMGPLPECSYN